MNKQDHTYRKQDVSGALSLVRELMADGWDAMPAADRPRTDREATSLFFQIDRSNANMAEFLEFLRAHNEQQRAALARAKRKPPKRLVGFVNMATGEKRPAFPDFLTLEPDAYDGLLALVRWIEATPECVKMGDRAWEAIHEAMADFVEIDDTQWPGVFVDSVQVETVDTIQRNITPGTLVVLLLHEDSDDSDEHHCVLVRGK